jgi:hypothetical protein
MSERDVNIIKRWAEKKEEWDKDIRLEERGERLGAQLPCKRKGTETTENGALHFLTAGNVQTSFAHHRAFHGHNLNDVNALITAMHAELREWRIHHIC